MVTVPVGSTPVPDPTELTSRAVADLRDELMLLFIAQLDVIRQRLDGMDLATELRWRSIDRIPVTVDEKVSHLSSIVDERFASIGTQFRERDTRSERESRDNKVAVDAAFAAQKEAASEQNKSNTLAIDKSEKATAETLNKQADLFKSTTDALADKIEEVKSRSSGDVSRLELIINGLVANRVGGRETTDDRRAGQGALYAAVGFGISLILAAITIVGVLAAASP